MPYLTWDGSMSVNVAELDDQHRVFLRVLNELHETLMNGAIHDVLLAPERTLGKLDQYLAEHFRSEEEYLAKIGYPDLEDHRRKHEEFAARVRGLREAHEKGDLLLNTELVKAMLEWLGDHLMAEDRKYAVFAAGARA